MRAFIGALRGREPAAILLAAGVMTLAACDTPSVPLDTPCPVFPDTSPDVNGCYDFRLFVPSTIGNTGAAQFLTFHWGRGSTVPVLVEEIPGSDRPSLRDAFEKAAETWNQAAVFSETRVVETSDPGEAVAVLMWDDTEPRYSTPGGCTGPTTGAAATRGCLTEDVERLQIWPRRDGGGSNLVFRVIINRSPGIDDDFLEILVTHELGHVLGILSHSNSSRDLMWGGAIDSAELSDADRLMLRSLYHATPDLEVNR